MPTMNDKQANKHERKQRRAMRRRHWAKKSVAEKLAVAWFTLLFGTLALGVTGLLLGAIIYAYIDLGFYHALPLTIGIAVSLLTLLAYLALED